MHLQMMSPPAASGPRLCCTCCSEAPIVKCWLKTCMCLALDYVAESTVAPARLLLLLLPPSGTPPTTP